MLKTLKIDNFVFRCLFELNFVRFRKNFQDLFSDVGVIVNLCFRYFIMSIECWYNIGINYAFDIL